VSMICPCRFTNHAEVEHYCLLHQQLLLAHLSDQGPGLAVPACQSRARQSTCSTGGWLLAAAQSQAQDGTGDKPSVSCKQTCLPRKQ
jgi:hypothetical protein